MFCLLHEDVINNYWSAIDVCYDGFANDQYDFDICYYDCSYNCLPWIHHIILLLLDKRSNERR